MGDTGALLIGLVLAILAIRFNEANVAENIPWHIASAPAVSIGILVLPLLIPCGCLYYVCTGEILLSEPTNSTCTIVF